MARFRKSPPTKFRAIEWAIGPRRRHPTYVLGVWTNYPVADATNKYLALSGKLLRSCSSCKVSYSRPTPADEQYDVNRARGYFEAMTGREAGKAVWADYPVHGEKRPRIRWIMDGNALWGIPYWDWNGHNDTVEDCELRFEFAA